MKLCFQLAFLICFFAQDLQSQTKNSFVRVCNFEMAKIYKGRLISIEGDILTLEKNKKRVTINISEIGFIRTKRSVGNNIGTGAAIGLTFGFIIGFGVGEDDGLLFASPAENGVVYGVLGTVGGSLLGGLTSLGKNSRTFEILGESEKLQKFKEIMFGQ